MQQQPRAHGTEGSYRAGCHCEACRNASAKAKRLRRERESKPGFGTPSLLPPKEFLTSQRGRDGLWHAHYPTATSLLCGQPVQPVDHFTPIEAWSPTCPICTKTAMAWDRIDGSIPDHWKAYDVAPPVEKDAA